jgi:hypothetical protein
MKISQNFHENFTKISFENSLVPDEMYAFPYVAEDEVVINEESDITELAEKRRRRAPEKYSPTWLMDSDAIAFMQEVDAARLVSEDAHRFIAVNYDNHW